MNWMIEIKRFCIKIAFWESKLFTCIAQSFHFERVAESCIDQIIEGKPFIENARWKNKGKPKDGIQTFVGKKS